MRNHSMDMYRLTSPTGLGRGVHDAAGRGLSPAPVLCVLRVGPDSAFNQLSIGFQSAFNQRSLNPGSTRGSSKALDWGERALSLILLRQILDGYDIGRVQPFGAFDDVKADCLAGFQRFVAVHRDGRVVCEEITTALIRKNETKAFGVVEPLYLSRAHAALPLSRVYLP